MRRWPVLVAAVLLVATARPSTQTAAPGASAGAAAPRANPTNLGTDANGNSLRLATRTGHVSNYDEA
jgi:hypothetical protein